MLKANKANDD